jgi:hypothetical protein
VAETTQFVNVVYSAITEKTIDLAIQVFSSLNEFCAVTKYNRKICIINVRAYRRAKTMKNPEKRQHRVHKTQDK